ncbi:MAG: HlyD family efflux transporter periplasmic adaptor subunit [Bacillota bacterium]
MGLGKKKWLILIMMFIIIGFIYSYYNQQPKFETVLYGEVTDSIEAEAVIIRDEEIVYSNNHGKVNLTFKEGEKAAYGQEIIEINGSDNAETFYADHSGLISYGFDGLEDEFNFTNLDQYDVNDFKNLKAEYEHLVDGKEIDEAEPVYRIVNNKKVYFIFIINSSNADDYSIGETVFLDEAKANNNLIKANITGKTSNSDETVLFVEVNGFKDEWLNRRFINFELISNIYRGLIVPKNSIFNTSKGRGVLVQNSRGIIEFRPLNLIGGNSKETVVEGLTLGDKVIINPEVLNYGRGD